MSGQGKGISKQHKIQQKQSKLVKQQYSQQASGQVDGEQPKIEVDSLARDKVDEVEKLLDSSDPPKPDDLIFWFHILKKIVTAADLHRTNDKNDKKDDVKAKSDAGESIYADYADDNEQFNAVDLTEQLASNPVKWTIRVRAFKILHRIVRLVSNICTLKLLPDLVRLAFVAATSPYDDLKMRGFEMFKFLIDRFATLEEKEVPGHSILEQYKTQVLSALKPAFNLDAPPYITAIASQVCALWICKGLETDSIGLKRAYQFMLQATEKLERQGVNHHSKLYTEGELEQERLSILDSWAQLYIISNDHELIRPPSGKIEDLAKRKLQNELTDLVRGNIETLIDKWWEALKDFALLTMPAPKFIGTIHDNENIYTREVALRLFEPIWPNLLYAVTIWLCSLDTRPDSEAISVKQDAEMNRACDNNDKISSRLRKDKYFKFTSGLLLRELCKCQSNRSQSTSIEQSTALALRSLNRLTNEKSMRSIIAGNLTIAEDLYFITMKIYVACITRKDPYYKNIHPILGSLFELIVTKVFDNSDKISHGLNTLSGSINSNLDDLGRAEDSSKSSERVATILIQLSNVISLIKLRPKHLDEHRDQTEQCLTLFKDVVEFGGDPSLGINLLNNLQGLYSFLSPERASLLATSLFSSELKIVSDLIRSIFDDENDNSGGINRLMPQLDVRLRLARLTIGHCMPDCRTRLIREYFSNITGPSPLIEKSAHTTRIKDMISLLLRNIDELEKSHPSEFKDALDQATLDLSKSIGHLRELLRGSKNAVVDQDERNTQCNTISKKKPNGPTRAKITLKADFSNFYAKKS